MKKIAGLMNKMRRLFNDKSGDQIVGLLVIVVITIIVGGLLLTLFSDSVADIWSSMVGKMKSVFSL